LQPPHIAATPAIRINFFMRVKRYQKRRPKSSSRDVGRIDVEMVYCARVAA
jgi:hypothetical protein